MIINNEQLKRENDVLKAKIDTMKDEIIQLQANQKEENKQLMTLLDKMAINNENQIQQIKSQSSEIAQLRTEVQQLKVSQ